MEQKLICEMHVNNLLTEIQTGSCIINVTMSLIKEHTVDNLWATPSIKSADSFFTVSNVSMFTIDVEFVFHNGSLVTCAA